LCSLPATAGFVLFGDLGPAGDVYGTWGWAVGGANNFPFGSTTVATLFSVAGTGSEPVSQIDLAVEAFNTNLSNTFSASIWTDNGGIPGAQVPGAYWALSSAMPPFTNFPLVSITGISGVSLTGGVQYFLVLGPLSDNSSDNFIVNVEGFNDNPYNPQGAFDVLSGTPEPSSLALLAAGAALLISLRRRRR
jgi:hypothetical protein